MTTPCLSDLPLPPKGRTGWPWTEGTPQLPHCQLDGGAWPKITIVTPSYNQGQYIEETIRSILLQGYPNIEYMVMDGGSTDKSVEIIKKYEPWIDYWESEVDRGQAHAINKGLNRASGEIFQFINSDDVLLPGALRLVGECATGMDSVCGNVEEFGSERVSYVVKNIAISVKGLIQNLWRTDQESWHQPGVFLKTANILKINGFDEAFGYAFDLHMTCRYFELFPNCSYLDAPLVKFRIHAQAKSSSWKDVYVIESIQVREKLSHELRNRRNRRTAVVAASRLRLFLALADSNKSHAPLDATQRALSIIRSEPSLLLDRMFLGSLRRRPILWFRALVSRPKQQDIDSN